MGEMKPVRKKIAVASCPSRIQNWNLALVSTSTTITECLLTFCQSASTEKFVFDKSLWNSNLCSFLSEEALISNTLTLPNVN